MVSLNLKGIDRNKRLTNYYIQIGIFLPVGIFFLLCFYQGRNSTHDETLMEQLFNFPYYWRYIGFLGVILITLASLFLHRIVPYKIGEVVLSPKTLTVKENIKFQEFHVSNMKELVVKKDLPHEGDTRIDSKSASRVSFKIGNHKYDIEMKILNQEEVEGLRNILEQWKEENPSMKIGYLYNVDLFSSLFNE